MHGQRVLERTVELPLDGLHALGGLDGRLCRDLRRFGRLLGGQGGGLEVVVR